MHGYFGSIVVCLLRLDWGGGLREFAFSNTFTILSLKVPELV